MKKLILTMLALAMCVTMFACGDDDSKNEDDTTTTTTTTDSDEEPVVSECVHNYQSDVTKESSCTEKGSTTYTCSECGYSYCEEIAILEHTYIDATCFSPKICSFCHKTEGEPLGHTFNNNVCSRCSELERAPSEGLEFELNSDEVSYSLVSIGNCKDNDIIIPSTYNGLPVTNIKNAAFIGCASLKSVVIPGSVTSIGNQAFYYCDSLTSITILDGVTSIGSNAFSDCWSLASITIPGSVTNIGDEVFSYCRKLESITVGADNTAYCVENNCLIENATNTVIAGCNLSSVVIPDGVTSIGDFAFSGRAGISSITIPDGVTSMGGWAFANCTGITNINIPASVMNVGEAAFNGCQSYPFTIYNGYYYLGNQDNPYHALIDIISAGIGANYTYSIHPSTVIIADGAFKYSYLTSIAIPDGVKSIGDEAFYHCERLANVTIPDSVTNIGSGTFSGCVSLESIIIPNSVTSIGSSAFYDCVSLESIIIPNSVTSIGYNAFYGCTSLVNVTIPDSVTSIGQNAFTSCDNLRYTIYGYCKYLGNANNPYHALIATIDATKNTYSIHPNTKIVASMAFFYCTSLTDITIPDRVISIDNLSFGACSSLTSINIPNSVTYIAEQAFGVCLSLTSINIPNSVTCIGGQAFLGCTNLTIYCETESKPEGWDDDWNYDDRPVVWGYIGE